MRKGYIVIILMFMLNSGSYMYCIQTSQEEQDSFQADSLSGDKYFERAEELYSSSEYDSSTYYYNLAAEIFRKEQRWEDYLKVKNYAGINYRLLAKLNESFNILNEVLSIGLEKFGTDNEIVADIYNSLGTSYYEKGDYDNAFLNYDKSLKISLKLFGDNHKNTARGYHNTGLIYYWTGDTQRALQYLNKALAIWLPALGEKHSNIGNCYINLANTYYDMDDYDRAISYDLKALEVWKAVLGEEHQYIAMSYNNMYVTCKELGRFDEALEYNEKALALRKKIFGEDHIETAASISDKAVILTLKKEYKAARENFDKALEILNKHYNSPRKYDAFFGIADLFKKTGEYDKALSYYDSILIYTHPEMIANTLFIDSVNFTSTRFGSWSALAGKGDVYYQKYCETKSFTDIQNALYWYQRYAALLEKIRSGFISETSKILVGKNVFNINSKLIKTVSELYKLTGEERYKEAAFAFSEKSKSAVLSNAIKESGARKFGGIPDSLVSKEKSLRIDLTYLDTKIMEAEEEGADIPEVLEMKKKLFDINKEYESLIKYFEEHYPGYYKLKHDISVTGIAEIQTELIEEDTGLLEYFISDSLVYIFAINKDKIEINTIFSPELSELVKNFRVSLQNIDYESYLTSAEKLYSLLIEPAVNILKNKKRIYIIPDGILNYLPFEALLTKNIQNKTDIKFGSLPYLINDFEISYHYSANLLLSNKRNSFPGKFSFAGFAPVFPDKESNQQKKIENFIDTSVISSDFRSVEINDKKYSSLPETETEVAGILNLFEAAGLDGEIYTYSRANEGILKSGVINKFTCVHLATHGFINEKRPKLSGLLFSDDTPDEDGILYPGEIYNLGLKANLVVLSACESGLGKVVKGEGIIGLTRGFIYSGAENILVSLWQVADKSTSELMIEFYKNLLEGKNYSAALREAKLKLIKEDIYSYPLEWSPFVLIGK